MPVLVGLHPSDARVLDLWNGSSNDAVPYDLVNDPPQDFRAVTYDDSAWDTPIAVTASSNMIRYHGTTRTVPNFSTGGQGLWPQTPIASNSQQIIIRWRFNPGPGPFTNYDLGVAWPFTADSSVEFWLNYDGITHFEHGTITTALNGIPDLTDEFLPNQENLLVIYVTPGVGSWGGVGFIEMGWRFPDAGDSFETHPISVTPITSTTIRRNFFGSLTGFGMTDSTGRVLVHGNAVNLLTGVTDWTIHTPERYDPQTLAWTSLADAPAWAYYTYSSDTDGTLYGALDITDLGVPSNAGARYDPGSNSWSSIATIPNSTSGRVQPAYWTSTGRLWVCGGTTTGGTHYHDTLYYEKGTDTWTVQGNATPTELFSGNAIITAERTVSSGALINAAGTTVYCLGFTSGHFYSYVLATDTWTQLTDSPYSSGNVWGCIADDRVYLSVGWDLWMYDPFSNTWTSLAAPIGGVALTPVTGPMVHVEGSLYALGVHSEGSFYTLSGPIQRYDIATNTWELTTLRFAGTGILISGNGGYYMIDETPDGRYCEFLAFGAAAASSIRTGRSYAQLVG